MERILPPERVVRGILHEEIHNGKVMICSHHSPDASPIADNGTLDVLVVTGPNEVNLTLITSAGGHAEFQLYRNTVVSDNGTEVVTANMNQNSNYLAPTKVYHTPTITNDGFPVVDAYVSSVLGGRFELRPDTEFDLKPNTNYLFRLVNRAGSNQPMGFIIQHYEETRLQ